MKEKKSNSVTNFEAEKITDNISVEFTRVVDSGNTTISGTVKKDDQPVGDVSYDRNSNFLITRIKPYSILAREEVAAVHAAIPGYVNEMLS